MLVNVTDLAVPLALSRVTGPLGAAMVPTMLITLGVQIRGMKRSPLGSPDTAGVRPEGIRRPAWVSKVFLGRPTLGEAASQSTNSSAISIIWV